MSFHEGRESFAVALHETAEQIEAPFAEFLYEGAVRRGKQIRRRRRTGAALTGVVAVGAAAAVAAVGLSGAGRATPAPIPVATISPKDVPKYMATTFMSVLPHGILLQTSDGESTLTGYGYSMPGNDGRWSAAAQTLIVYQGQKYTASISVADGGLTCQEFSSLVTCNTKRIGSATLVYPGPLKGASQLANEDYNLDYSDGKSVQLQVMPNTHNTASIVPITEQQAEQIVTSPAWNQVLADLPAPVSCPILERAPGSLAATEWLCATTGKLYPIEGQSYGYFG